MSIIEKLVSLQEHDCRIRDLEREMRDIPLRKDQEKTRLEEHRDKLSEAEQMLKALQADIKKVELEAESLREKITKLRQQQFSIKTNKEFKAIEDEIGLIQTQIGKLEDRELELMMKADQAKLEVERGRAMLAAEEAAVKADIQALDERASRIAAEIDQLRSVRAAIAAEIDPAWLASYERIFQRKERAIVPIEDGVCGGCHMQLPPFVLHDAKKQTALVACTFCGRLLY